MLFNSYAFILAFLPVTLAVYFLLCRGPYGSFAQLWLVLASLYFYGHWSAAALPVILASILCNFAVSRAIWQRQPDPHAARLLLILGIGFNLALLGFFKYSNFLLENLNLLTGAQHHLLSVALPLGISFFSFTQIAFLVDTYQRRASRPTLTNYALFVTYFPHLLAGPILHHREMMPQFDQLSNRRLNANNFARGMLQFSFGLAKKVLLADSFAEIADRGFSRPGEWSPLDAWIVAAAYALQLYFDFSGYTDMALGISRMFNIHLPINFDSPYRSLSIREFWHRWHMTLSRFLGRYLYIPLGGNRQGRYLTARNLLLTFLLGGLWHGAGWTFVVWGALHGFALIIERVWTHLGGRMPASLAWMLTFGFLTVTWVFFRADSLPDALALVGSMFGRSSVSTFQFGIQELVLLSAGLLLATLGPNSNVIAMERRLSAGLMLVAALLLAAGLLSLDRTSPFIYFNF